MYRSKKAAELNKSPSTSYKAVGPTSQATSERSRNSSEVTHSVETTSTIAVNVDASAYTLFNVTSSPSKPFVVTLQIDGADLRTNGS